MFFFFTTQRILRNGDPLLGAGSWAGVASLTSVSYRSSAAEEPRVVHLEAAHG